ncbi:MAG: LysR family transcriptional regulator [Pseudomonadota bacterium]
MSLHLNLEQLRAFLMVAQYGGVRAAAEKMHLSQPAVTARIKALESALATRLFDRSSRGMTLTKRGQALQRYAEQYRQLVELIEHDIVDPEGVERHLRIGVSETIVQSWLPDLIAALRRDFPRIEIELSVDISLALREGLMNRSLDLAVLMGPISEYSVENVNLPDFPLDWYCAADQVLPEDPAEMFLRQPVVTYARNTRPYRELKTALYNRYGPGVTIFTSSSLSACFRMVAAGLGIAALPVALAGPELRTGRVICFNPGWRPDALCFTASYLADPESPFLHRIAQTARQVALVAADQDS